MQIGITPTPEHGSAMGCRPSKQATSKVRAVEHKEDFKCSCSPRKIRKHHKCASGSNLSRRISGSGRGGSKQSLSSNHKPRSSKSADVDFPAFSTTTAVYRTSASKTSKITLRLSCDGSTLEIEQCDYDLEKVRGESESKPRPWNSAPNLTKMRDSKSRLFRDSYLPIKHSKSGWSPSFLSPTCSNRGGFFRAPVQVNTPDDSQCSSSNISGYSFSVFSQGGSSYRDKNNVYHAFESTTFAGKTFGKTSLNKSTTSSKCSSGDERRPLLLDILKESHKKASLEGNINKASSAASMENTNKDGSQTCSSLDNMINELETSLAMVHRLSCSSVPQTARPYSLDVGHLGSVDIHHPAGSCCPGYPEQPTPVTFTLCPSPDVEQIPVNVISSFITCQGQPVACVECDRNFYPLVPSPDIYCSVNQRQDKHSAVMFDPPCAGKQCQNSHPECSTDNNRVSMKQRESNDISKKHTSPLMYSDHKTTKNATDGISEASQISLHLAPLIDSNSIVPLAKEDCSAGNKHTSLLLSSVDTQTGSLQTDENNVSCLSDRGRMFELDSSHPRLDCARQTVHACVVDCQTDNVYRSKDTILQFQAQNALNNLNEGGADKAECTSRNQDELSGRTLRLNNPPSATSNIFPGAQCHCSDARRAQMTGIEFRENESEIRHGENFSSSLEVIDGSVRENYINLHQSKQKGEGMMCADERTTFSHLVGLDSVHCTQQKSKQEVKTRHENLELHCVNNRQKLDSGTMEQVQVCHECMTKISNGSINSNLHLIKKNSQPGCFSHRVNENTSLSQEINDSPWQVLHSLDVAPANETKSSLSNSNFEFGRQSSNEMRHLNTGDPHGTDRFSEDAGYLLSLLFPERSNFINPLNSNTRFSFDFEYLDESETTCSSNSDSSDNEISPLCYSLLGQQDSCESYRRNLNCHLRDRQEGINTETAITSMQNVREFIVYQRLATMDPCVSAIENRCADLQISLDLTSERNSFNSRVYSKDSESCFMGFPQRERTGDFSLVESCPLLRKMENSITRTSNIIHGNELDNSRGNDLGNKQGIMILGGDITVPNYSASISAAGKNFPKHDDTDTEVCENLSFAKLSFPDTDTNSFCSLLAFSETSEGKRKRLLGFSNSSDVTADRQTPGDATSGQVLIQDFTSACCHTSKNSGRRRAEDIINTEDRHLADKTTASVENSRGQAITDNKWALEALLSEKHATHDTEAGRRNSRDNDTCCSVDDRFPTQGSLDYESSPELDAINSSMHARLYNVDTGKNPRTLNERTAIMANGMQVLLSSQRQIDRLNNNSSGDDEYTASLSSLSQATTNNVNAVPATGFPGRDADNHGVSCTMIGRDLLVSGNNQEKCREITTSKQEAILSERSSLCCHQQREECMFSEDGKQMVSCSEGAALQQNPSIISQNSACQPKITNTQVQCSYPSQNISCSLAVVSADKPINGKQTFYKQYHLLDHIHQDNSKGNNATLESRSSRELGNVYLGSLLTSDSSKPSRYSSKVACLAADPVQEDGFIPGSNPGKFPITLGNPSVSSESVTKGMLDNVGQEQIEESLYMPRNNVLSLVRYFEKVPYTRRETKQ